VSIHSHGPKLRPGDEPMCNHSPNPTFSSILESRLQRRQVLQGGIAAAVATFFGLPALNSASKSAKAASGSALLGFKAIPVSAEDKLVVPEGYTARPLLAWGTPITGTYPQFKLENTGAEQGMQVGTHHDGMHFFPIEGKDPWQGSSTEGLLVFNHEYVEPRFMHAAAVGQKLDSDCIPPILTAPAIPTRC